MTKPAIQSTDDRILDLKEMTEARVALGRFGSGMPTKATLAFLLDHARAREAVWTAMDRKGLEHRLSALGLDVIAVESRATERSIYVRRPDLGRRLSDASLSGLQSVASAGDGYDVVIVVADGLSSSAVEVNAVPLVEQLILRLRPQALSVGPIIVAEQARVALADPIGDALGAKLTIMLIGERPGLSAADSLGAYITYEPKSGTPDSRRNCISNIRDGGLPVEAAADAIALLVSDMAKTRLSGVGLKDAVAKLAAGSHGAIPAEL